MDWAGPLAVGQRPLGNLMDNVFRSLTVPATGGFFSAIVIFVVVLRMMLRAFSAGRIQRCAHLSVASRGLISLPTCGFGGDAASRRRLAARILVDVIVDAQGQIPPTKLLLARIPGDAPPPRPDPALLAFRPMMSFGRPTPGGHVVLSFSESTSAANLQRPPSGGPAQFYRPAFRGGPPLVPNSSTDRIIISEFAHLLPLLPLLPPLPQTSFSPLPPGSSLL